MADDSRPSETSGSDDAKHLHVRLKDPHSAIYDLITEYLQAAGKAADWYWRTAGRLEGTDSENLEELLASAFEAGAFIAHEHPEELVFRWVDESECERERKDDERGSERDGSRKERGTMSHYA
ncbi:MAG TPA: hypothetical protein VGS23_09555 [Thermoplasmata archaeon]|nr:hypothetical protein [Thermoplasmata archaeon]